MPTTWTIAIDWDTNGNYTGTDDNITSYVMQANWFIGFRKPYMDMADNTLCTLIIKNDDKRFSPENPSSPLYGKLLPLRPIRIQSNDGTTTRTHWVGWIERIEPLPGKFGKRYITIIGAGAIQFLLSTETQLALQENKRTDIVVDALMKEVIIPPALTQATFPPVPVPNTVDFFTNPVSLEGQMVEEEYMFFNIIPSQYVVGKMDNTIIPLFEPTTTAGGGLVVVRFPQNR